MSRLPNPGSDETTWGDILNDFLQQGHNADGTIKDAGVVASKATNTSVVHNTGNETIDGVKSFTSSPVVPTPTSGTAAANKIYVDNQVLGAAPNASATVKGKVQLAGDLAGTAESPVVQGLAGQPIPAYGSTDAGTGLLWNGTAWTKPGLLQLGQSLIPGPAQPYRYITSSPPGTPSTSVFEAGVLHNPTDATPSQLTSLGIQSYNLYGSPDWGSTAVTGTVHAFTGLVDVVNSAADGNEHAAFMGWVRYAAGAKGRAWFTDYSLQGPIGTRPDLLTGINMFINQYYNGTPTSGPSAGQWIITKPGQGAGREAGHEAATTYKVDVGLGIVGFAGRPGARTRGYEVGLQIGGYGSGWMLSGETSIIGTGISIKDTQDQAIAIAPTGAAGAIVWGGAVKISPVSTDGLQILSSSAHKLGLYGKAPVAQAAAIASPTADLTSLKTSVDAIRTALKNIGITA